MVINEKICFLFHNSVQKYENNLIHKWKIQKKSKIGALRKG